MVLFAVIESRTTKLWENVENCRAYKSTM